VDEVAEEVAMRIPEEIAQRSEGFIGRLWVLDEIAEWLEKDSRRFFLLLGEPGSGKTALAAWFAGAGPDPADASSSATLRRIRAALGAAHFCVARGQGSTVNPNAFTQSIASQLSPRLDGYAEHVVQHVAAQISVTQKVRENLGEVVGVKLVAAGRNPADMYEQLVRDPLQALSANNSPPAVVVMVDALDEALEWREHNNIAELVGNSGDFPPGVRFLLTSRVQQRVVDLFRQEDRRVLNISGQDRETQSDADVRSYVDNRVAADRIDLGTPTSADEVVRSAAGNFLYAKFVLDEVAAGLRAPGKVTGLPAELFGLYREFVRRLVDRSGVTGLWQAQYGPLLGCVSVAEPAAPLPALSGWLGWSGSTVVSGLSDLDQVTERIQDHGGGYRLYHFSMAQFLGSLEYQENGTTVLNEYHLDPAEQHHRIASYYLGLAGSVWAGDWSRCDEYGLRQLTGHLKARADLAKGNGGQFSDLYGLLLNPSFRLAQSEVLGDVFATLADLRTGLDVALRHDDLLTALRLIAAHRDVTAAEGITNSVFDALDRQDFPRALRGGAHYGVAPKPRSRWSRVLQFYLAWEAALAGDEAAARTAVEQAEEIVSSPVDELADALLVRTARTLARVTRDPDTWLSAFGRTDDAAALLSRFDTAVPRGLDEPQTTIAQLEPYLDQLDMRYDAGAEGLADEMLTSGEEEVSWLASNLQSMLSTIAAYPEALGTIDRALGAVAVNAYPRYRDIGLAAVGVAIASIPDAEAARPRLRGILTAGLDDEGVTFTFDLAEALLTEAKKRKRSQTGAAGVLSEYLTAANRTQDVWGTATRARCARASARFRQGDLNGALDELAEAAALPRGFAGYATMVALSIISRCFEFGTPARASAPQWGPDRDSSLGDLAMRHAQDVRDYEFQQERIELVQAFLGWVAEPAPDIDSMRAFLAATSDPDFRRAYKDLASARWASDPTPTNRTALKALVQLLLADSTTLDSVLARLFRVEMDNLTDDAVEGTLNVCAEHFTQGRPWEQQASIRMS